MRASGRVAHAACKLYIIFRLSGHLVMLLYVGYVGYVGYVCSGCHSRAPDPTYPPRPKIPRMGYVGYVGYIGSGRHSRAPDPTYPPRPKTPRRGYVGYVGYVGSGCHSRAPDPTYPPCERLCMTCVFVRRSAVQTLAHEKGAVPAVVNTGTRSSRRRGRC
jgi:hypothetical protein